VPKPRVHRRTPKPQAPKAKLVRQTKPLLAVSTPVASQGGGPSPTLLIVVFGLALALVGIAASLLPESAVPYAMRLRLERGRQTIMLVGVTIGVACALVGLLTALLNS
jgi:hypothetical protein